MKKRFNQTTAASMLDGDVLRDLRAEDVDTSGYQAILKTLSKRNIG